MKKDILEATKTLSPNLKWRAEGGSKDDRNATKRQIATVASITLKRSIVQVKGCS